ncbi:21109_t:CDS:2 [Entrophospora sp. SA101]|nr:21109_t:CDS:2 [Entrophospora sp. SA101]
MLRPLGAAIFGLLADRYGRRYPLILDIILYSLMELLSGFAPNFTIFMVFRAIFGIAMGGEWGLGAAMAMETLPPETRGIFSGILQQGYAFGYLLASVVYYFVIDSLGWRALFWIGSFPALLVIFIRFFVPESPVWKSRHEKNNHSSSSNRRGSGTKLWLADIKLVLKNHWKRFIYTILLMTGFGTQDLYPTFLRLQLGFTSIQITTTLIIANVGAIIGGMSCGYFSEYLGRRRTIIISVFLAGCFVPLYVLSRNQILISIGAKMDHRFVSSTDLEEAKRKRAEEWKAAYERLGQKPPEKEKEEYDPRTLYERLQEQKMKKEEAFQEMTRFSNLVHRLDEDEIEFLAMLDNEEKIKELDKSKKVEKELEEFRRNKLNSKHDVQQKILANAIKKSNKDDHDNHDKSDKNHKIKDHTKDSKEQSRD